MTNKLVVIINSQKYQKLRKFYYIKWNFLYQITAASRTPDWGATAPRSPSSLSSILNWICWTSHRKKIPGYATARSRVLLEKLNGFELVKKFHAFYGTRRFITAFTSARHLSLSWASSIQSTPPHPTCWKFILILSSHLPLDLSSGLLPSGFPTKNDCHFVNHKSQMYWPGIEPVPLRRYDGN